MNETQETHSDTAFLLVQSVEVLGHAVRHAIASAEWPGGAKVEYPSVSLYGMAPEVVELMAKGADLPPKWLASQGVDAGKAGLYAQIFVAGVGVHLHSAPVAGKLSTEFVRSEES